LDVESGARRILAQRLERHVESPFILEPLGWSGDGAVVYLVARCDCGAQPRGLYGADALTGEFVAVQGADQVSGSVTLAPDGTRVAYATDDISIDAGGDLQRQWPNRVVVLDLASSSARVVAEPDLPDRFLGPPTWSPDGTRLAFDLGGHSAVDSISSVDVRDGSALPVIEGAAMAAQQLAWLPGDRFAMSGRPGSAVDIVLRIWDIAGGIWIEIDRAPAIEIIGWYR